MSICSSIRLFVCLSLPSTINSHSLEDATTANYVTQRSAIVITAICLSVVCLLLKLHYSWFATE